MLKEYLALGASLYVPATHPYLAEIGNGLRLPQLRSVIFCTEDAISPEDLERAMERLAETLPRLGEQGPARFVRVRNPKVLAQLIATAGVEALQGFVLPKATPDSLDDYLRQLPPAHRFRLMPTLETAETFDQREMVRFRQFLLQPHVRSQILALRIGGSDLLRLLGVRRMHARPDWRRAACSATHKGGGCLICMHQYLPSHQ
jgi:citrate lyase beta subunit